MGYASPEDTAEQIAEAVKQQIKHVIDNADPEAITVAISRSVDDLVKISVWYSGPLVGPDEVGK